MIALLVALVAVLRAGQAGGRWRLWWVAFAAGVRATRLSPPDDLSRLNAAFFTMNGVISRRFSSFFSGRRHFVAPVK